MRIEGISNPIVPAENGTTEHLFRTFVPFANDVDRIEFSPKSNYLILHRVRVDENEDEDVPVFNEPLGFINDPVNFETAIVDIPNARIALSFPQEMSINFSPDDRYFYATPKPKRDEAMGGMMGGMGDMAGRMGGDMAGMSIEDIVNSNVYEAKTMKEITGLRDFEKALDPRILIGKFCGFLNDGRYVFYGAKPAGKKELDGSKPDPNRWLSFCRKDENDNVIIDSQKFNNPAPEIISPNGKFAVCLIEGVKKTGLKVFDLITGEPIGFRGAMSSVENISFSNDGKALAFVDTNIVRTYDTIFDVEKRELTFQLIVFNAESKTFEVKFKKTLSEDDDLPKGMTFIRNLSNLSQINATTKILGPEDIFPVPIGFFPVMFGPEGQLIGKFDSGNGTKLKIYDWVKRQYVFSHTTKVFFGISQELFYLYEANNGFGGMGGMGGIEGGGMGGMMDPGGGGVGGEGGIPGMDGSGGNMAGMGGMMGDMDIDVGEMVETLSSSIVLEKPTQRLGILTLFEGFAIDEPDGNVTYSGSERKLEIIDTKSNSIITEIEFGNDISTGCLSSDLSKVAVMQFGPKQEENGIMIYRLKEEADKR